MGSWAIVKKGSVIDVIEWMGPDISPMAFSEGVDAIEYTSDNPAHIGDSYSDGKFSPPPLTDEQIAWEKQGKISSNIIKKQSLIDQASQKISIYQDAVDLEMATDEEITALPIWKKYRVLLSRVDANTSDDIAWPSLP